MNDTLLTALALIPALVIAIVFHEVAHGWIALALGDPTAKEQQAADASIRSATSIRSAR